MRLLTEKMTPTAKVKEGKVRTCVFRSHGRWFGIDGNVCTLYEVNQAEAATLSSLDKSTSVWRSPFEPSEIRKPVDPSFVVINITDKCNLDCKYCFAEHGDQSLPDETVSKAIKFASGDKPKVGFFGGEPLLEWQRIKGAVIRYEANNTKPIQWHLTTNATLLTLEIAKQLARLDFSIIVSLDGPKDIHEQSRGNSFDKVMAGLEYLKTANLKRVTVRGTYTPDNLRLVERGKFYTMLLKQGLARSVALEPVSLAKGQTWTGSGLHGELEVFSEYLVAAPKRILLKRLSSPYDAIIKRLREGKPHVYNCGAGNGYISISPDAKIHACHRLDSEIGTFASGFDNNRDGWINRCLPKDCSECWARYVCGGGCHAAHTFEQSMEHCTPMKMIIKECAWLINAMGSTT